MLPLEIIMIISNICAPIGKLDKDIENSVKCNQSIVSCMQTSNSLPNEALTRCIINYELNRK